MPELVAGEQPHPLGAGGQARGATSGRRPQIAALGVLEEVRQAYYDEVSIAALAREHQVSRVAIRTAVADLLPGRDASPAPAVEGSRPVRVEIPGTLARHLAERDGLGEAERDASRRGREVRRGQGYSLHVTALPEVHHALLAAAEAFKDARASAVERKAYASLETHPRVPVRDAQAVYRALAAPGVYRELVEESGWTADEFERWVSDALERQLLA